MEPDHPLRNVAGRLRFSATAAQTADTNRIVIKS
jgi:hypothetical protein